MDRIAYLKQDFACNPWANREVFRAVGAAASPPPRAVDVTALLVGAEWAWLRRPTGAAGSTGIGSGTTSDLLPEDRQDRRHLSVAYHRRLQRHNYEPSRR